MKARLHDPQHWQSDRQHIDPPRWMDAESLRNAAFRSGVKAAPNRVCCWPDLGCLSQNYLSYSLEVLCVWRGFRILNELLLINASLIVFFSYRML